MGGGGGEIEETEYEKEMAKIASEKWGIVQENLAPLEDMMIADVSKGITAEERGKVSGAIGLSHQKEFGAASQKAAADMAASGVDPTSAKYKESLADLSRGAGSSRAAAEAEGEAGLQSTQVGEEMNIARIGAGESAQAQQSLSDVAGRAAQKAGHEAQMAYQENQGLRELAGTVAGAAGTYYAPKKKSFDEQHASKFGIKGY